MNNKGIIFNLSRLVARRYCSTPTGIDRVELRHARYVLDQSKNRNILFVHQYKNTLVPISHNFAVFIINSLWNRWVLNESDDKKLFKSELHHFSRLVGYASFKRKGKIFVHPDIIKFTKTNKKPIYINSGHHGTQYAELHRKLKQQYVLKLVFYLHDLIPIDYPEYDSSSDKAIKQHSIKVRMMAEHASLVLVNSEYTKARFITFCKKNEIAPPKVEVLHIGVEEYFFDVPQTVVGDVGFANLNDSKYFVFVSTIEPRKNHIMLLHIWRELATELGSECPKLVLIGRRGWKFEHVTMLLDSSPALQDIVIELNNISDTKIRMLIQKCVATLYPSFEEGWGMPVAESLALGKLCVCADIPALRESSQEKAIYLSPLDGLGWKDIILQLVNKESESLLDNQNKDKISEFRPANWAEHIARLDVQLHNIS